MQVRYGEGLAIHTDPESCAGIREGAGEALTGGRIGGVSSGVSDVVRGADAVVACRRQSGGARQSRVPQKTPAWSETLAWVRR